jgi:hypothetical protein
MALPFLFLISLIIIRNLQRITEIQFKYLEEEVRNNFNSNPVWGSKVGKLKKVKDRNLNQQEHLKKRCSSVTPWIDGRNASIVMLITPTKS